MSEWSCPYHGTEYRPKCSCCTSAVKRNRNKAGEAYSRLIKLCAEMARGEGMPSEFEQDWEWAFTKSVPRRVRAHIIGTASKANNQCRSWATRLRQIADELEPKGQCICPKCGIRHGAVREEASF